MNLLIETLYQEYDDEYFRKYGPVLAFCKHTVRGALWGALCTAVASMGAEDTSRDYVLIGTSLGMIADHAQFLLKRLIMDQQSKR